MTRVLSALVLSALFWSPGLPPSPACCPVFRAGAHVVNADQTVIMLWDAASRTQHFIRKASFKTEADDFGFLIPTPEEPQLEESGDDAFPYLAKLTEPEVKASLRLPSLTCSHSLYEAPSRSGEVHVRQEKEVAGFKAVVLETRSATALAQWLKDNGFAFSPAVQAWAKPYVEAGWKITALKVAKNKDDQAKTDVAAAALRLSFRTERPLFPYREPEAADSAQALAAKKRLLRIYFLAEAKYQGQHDKRTPWSGKVVWANKLSAEQRRKTLELLKLPANTGPAEWWLTEFEDNWPYQAAPGDVYFSRAARQDTVRRPVQYAAGSGGPIDVTLIACAGLVLLPPLLRRFGRRRADQTAG